MLAGCLINECMLAIFLLLDGWLTVCALSVCSAHQGLLKDEKAADAKNGIFNHLLAKFDFAKTAEAAGKKADRLKEQVERGGTDWGSR